MAKQKYWNGFSWEVIGTDADQVSIKDSSNLFSATDVEGALKELFTNVSDGKSLVGGAITDVDPEVVVPADATFQELADAIGQINTGRKWASGTTTTIYERYSVDGYTYARRYMEVTGLAFKPSIIIGCRSDLGYISHLSSTFYWADVAGTEKKYVSDSSTRTLIEPYYVNDGGFKLAADTESSSKGYIYKWIAIE
jgi:hypothetical protein